MRFIDTNILLYAVSSDPSESAKRHRARDVIDADDCALSVQVLQEFYVQATRANRQTPLSHDLAVEHVKSWRRFPVQDMTVAVFENALLIKAAHGFSHWDCAILSAAKALGCDEVVTEDLSHGRVVEGMRIVNPFR